MMTAHKEGQRGENNSSLHDDALLRHMYHADAMIHEENTQPRLDSSADDAGKAMSSTPRFACSGSPHDSDHPTSNKVVDKST